MILTSAEQQAVTKTINFQFCIIILMFAHIWGKVLMAINLSVQQ